MIVLCRNSLGSQLFGNFVTVSTNVDFRRWTLQQCFDRNSKFHFIERSVSWSNWFTVKHFTVNVFLRQQRTCQRACETTAMCFTRVFHNIWKTMELCGAEIQITLRVSQISAAALLSRNPRRQKWIQKLNVIVYNVFHSPWFNVLHRSGETHLIVKGLDLSCSSGMSHTDGCEATRFPLFLKQNILYV